MKNIYYVYIYLREDNTPYYVGKGSRSRYIDKQKHTVKLPPRERIKFVAENLTEHEAFNLEKELIVKYGRKDLGTGILRNLTDGGEGSSGYRHTNETKEKMAIIKQSKEYREKMSLAKKGYKPSLETIEKIKKSNTGKSHTQETKEKIGKANSRPCTDEQRKKLSEAAKGNPKPKVECCGRMWDFGNLARHRRGDFNLKCSKLF
jgi:hypothetical protein